MENNLEKIVSNDKHMVVRQDWLESERGWGIRPDGCTLHLTRNHWETYIKEYWSRMPSEVPDEYSRPSGEPYGAMVGKEIYDRIAASKNGIALCQSDASRLR
jgi:hypothetical protein